METNCTLFNDEVNILSNNTICAALSIPSRRNKTPRKKYQNAITYISSYLNLTKNNILALDREMEAKLEIYADDDWGWDVESKHSTCENLYSLG